jgi:NADPH:quinone reductase-like Zn-dependent oxidoreductase
MRAAVLKRTKDLKAHPENIKIEQVPVPVPLPGEMLIKVLGSSVNPSDVDLIKSPVGLPRMGNDVSGIVVSTDIGCGKRLKKGDEVFASNAALGGAWAEYAAIPCFGVAKKPKGLNFTEAGVLAEVGATGLQSLQWAADPKTKRLDNMTVVVLGGAGGTGHVGIQIAKALGAAEVITTCGPDHFDFVKSMGADRAINYHTDKWYDVLANKSVDVVYDCVAQAGTGSHAFPKLKEGGRYAALLPFSLAGHRAKKQRPDIKQKAIFCTDCAFHTHLDALSALVDAGKLRPHVDQAYELADVGGAVNRLMAGHATGKVAIVMKQPAQIVIV